MLGINIYDYAFYAFIVFVTIWVIIGVGVLVLIIKGWKILKDLEDKINSFKIGLTEASKVLGVVQNSKDILVPLLSLLVLLKKKFFNKKAES